MNELHALFIIGAVAVFAPLLSQLSEFVRIPAVVLELVLGIAIGPSGAGLVNEDGAIGFLAEFGLIFLFFQAGFEFHPGKIGTEPLRLGALAWLASLGLTCVFVELLYLMGMLRAPLLVALVLPTNAFGMLVPILRDFRELNTKYGRYVLGAGAIGALGPMILAPVVVAQAHNHLVQTFLSMLFLAIAVAAILFARSLQSERLSRMIERWMTDTSVLPIRISILILLGFTGFAHKLGMEMVLGAYTAGTMIAMMAKVEILQYRLTSIGSGFFIPLFFIVSGVEFDLPALLASPGSIGRLFIFCAGFLLIRVLPVGLYKNVLPQRDLLPLALFSATTLPLVVAVTYLGVRSGDMLPANAAALVGAAVITVVVFPALAIFLRAKPEQAQLDRVVTDAVCRAADFANEQFSRLMGFVTEKVSGKRET